MKKSYATSIKTIILTVLWALCCFGVTYGIKYFFCTPAIEELDKNCVSSNYPETYKQQEKDWKYNGSYLTHAIIDTSELEKVLSVQDLLAYRYDVMQYLSHVPEPVLDAMKNKGWTIRILTDEQDDYIGNIEGTNSHVYGYTDYDNKIIVLEADSEMIGSSSIHELGHALYIEYLIGTFRLKGIWRHDADELENIYFHDGYDRPYITEQVQEAIAQSFYEYICYSQQLQEASPVIYNVWNKLMIKLNQ